LDSLTAGCRVRIVGLKSAEHLNGHTARVMAFDGECLQVEMHDEARTRITVSPSNLRHLELRGRGEEDATPLHRERAGAGNNDRRANTNRERSSEPRSARSGSSNERPSERRRERSTEERVKQAPYTSFSTSHTTRGRSSLPSPEEILLTYQQATAYVYDVQNNIWKAKKCNVLLDEIPLAMGPHKVVFKTKLLSTSGKPPHDMVAKQYKDAGLEEAAVFAAVMSLGLASQYAKAFNAELQLNELPERTCRVHFNQAFVLRQKRGGRVMLLEPLITEILPSRTGATHTQNVSQLLMQGAEAYTHYTWRASGQQLLISNLQGNNQTYWSADAHAPNERLVNGNRGQEGVKEFFAHHDCNSLCRMLKLQPETTRLEKKSDAANCSRAKFTGKSHDKRQSQNTLDVQVFEDLLHDHSPELHDGRGNSRERAMLEDFSKGNTF